MGRLDANKLIKDAAGEGSEGHEEHTYIMLENT